MRMRMQAGVTERCAYLDHERDVIAKCVKTKEQWGWWMVDYIRIC